MTLRCIDVVGSRAIATVQDLGRPGRMHEGIPAGGALVATWLRCVNAAVGNPVGLACIEWTGEITVQASDAVTVAWGRAPEVRTLRAGETLTATTPRDDRVGYLAVSGGFDVPEVLGGRGTMLVAAFGGWHGRLLWAGDRLPVGRISHPSGHATSASASSTWEPGEPIRIVPGPDVHRFERGALATLLREPFAISRVCDRVGTRLDGPAIGRRELDDRESTATFPGAVQVPAGGTAIVLGPDAPVTGGYPVVAAVVSADLDRFHARAPGAAVRFVRARSG